MLHYPWELGKDKFLICFLVTFSRKAVKSLEKWSKQEVIRREREREKKTFRHNWSADFFSSWLTLSIFIRNLNNYPLQPSGFSANSVKNTSFAKKKCAKRKLPSFLLRVRIGVHCSSIFYLCGKMQQIECNGPFHLDGESQSLGFNSKWVQTRERIVGWAWRSRAREGG